MSRGYLSCIAPTGSVAVLKMTHEEVVFARRRWAAVGWYPPIEDLG